MTQPEAVRLLNKRYYNVWSFTTQGAEREVLPGGICYKVKGDLHIAKQNPFTITGMGFGIIPQGQANPANYVAAHNAALEGALVNAVQRLGLTSDKS